MRLSKSSTLVFAAAFLAAIGMGCSDSKPSTPKASVEAQVGPGTEEGVNDSAKCQLKSEPWAIIGDPASGTISDGDPVDGATLIVRCTVRPDGDGFRVEANAEIQNKQGFSVTGHFTPTGAQANVIGSWNDINTGTFRQEDCTADYSSNSIMSVAAGRVWANITCPHATISGTDRTCLATAQFRFENCSQE